MDEHRRWEAGVTFHWSVWMQRHPGDTAGVMSPRVGILATCCSSTLLKKLGNAKLISDILESNQNWNIARLVLEEKKWHLQDMKRVWPMQFFLVMPLPDKSLDTSLGFHWSEILFTGGHQSEIIFLLVDISLCSLSSMMPSKSKYGKIFAFLQNHSCLWYICYCWQ